MSIPPSEPSTKTGNVGQAPRFVRRLLGQADARDGITIRKLRAEDLPRFFFPADLPQGEKWLNLQERGEMYVAVAEIDGAAVGRSCLLYNPRGDPPNAYSFASSVSSEWRSHGVGSALVAHNEAVARSRGMYHIAAHAAHDNPRSAAWREQMGYRRVCEETIRWEEADGTHESRSWRFERSFPPPVSYRIRRWLRKRLSSLRRRLGGVRLSDRA